MTTEELVIRIQTEAATNENMNLLYERVKSFIGSLAWKYRDAGELEDLMQEGFLALYPAIKNYDPAAGVKFLTYAGHWIEQRIKSYTQNNSSCLRMPVHCLEKIQKMKKYQSDYEREHGRKPTEDEIARFMWLTLEQVRKLQENACIMTPASLEAPITGTDGTEQGTLMELVAASHDQESEILNRMEQERLRCTVWHCVAGLPGIQPDIVRKRYQERKTVKECGASLGVSEAEARKQHNKALQTLRSGQTGTILRSFLPEASRTYSRAIIGGGVRCFERTWTSSTERVALKL